MEIEICRQGESIELELEDGVIQVGGGEADGLCIPGVPPALVLLRIDGGRLVVEGSLTLPINGVPCPPRVPRLLLPDERIALTRDVLLGPVAAPPQPLPSAGGTAALLRDYLGGRPEPHLGELATLTCLTGLDMGRVYPLADGGNEIGRGDGVAIRVRDRAVSRRHARVQRDPRGFTIEDLGSPNGLYVDGERVTAPRPLVGGEVLEVGRSLLRFTVPPEPPPPERPSPSDFQASPTDADPAESRTAPQPPVTGPARARGPRLEWLLIATGTVFALAGALVTWGLAR